MKNGRHRLVFGLAVIAAALGSGYFIGRARANGIPTTNAMTYSGRLLLANGMPATGTHNIGVKFFTDNQSTNGVGPTSTASNVDLTASNGLFSVPLDDQIAGVVHADPDLYVQILVDGTPVTTTGLPKLGAVPYAIEAANASRLFYTNPIGPAATKTTSVAGVFCGQTTALYSGSQVGGYAGAKAKCQAVSGCSPTAHMCRVDEMVRYVETGAFSSANQYGWITSGVYAEVPGSIGAMDECQGFNTAGQTEFASTWDGAVQRPAYQACNGSMPIMCCD